VAAGRLRFPPEAWWYVAFVAASLVSARALTGATGDAWLYLRGLATLLAGGAALLLAANQPPGGEGWSRWLRAATVFLVLLAVVGLAVAAGWLPLSWELPWGDDLPRLARWSAFVREHVVERHLARVFPRDAFADLARYNGFFFYQGGMATAVLALQPLVLLARGRLGRRWDRLGLAALLGGLLCLVLSRTRLPLVLGTASLAAIGLWRALEGRPWRRWVVRALGATALLAAVWLVVPSGGEAPWERAFIDVRISSFINRMDAYTATLARVAERPAFGWGIQERAAQGSAYLRLGTHSDPLSVLYRFGACGLALYLAAWIASGVGVGRAALGVAARGRDGELADLLAVAVSLAALAANALFRDLQWDVNVFWLCAALAGTGRAHAWAAARRVP
jgi:hypothetical protein